MTISEILSNWLAQFKGIEVETNFVEEGADKYGLFKSPQRDVKDFINLSYEITEYYQLFARQSIISDADRKEADELLEELTYWADDYAYNYEYPVLDKNRKILDIKVTGSPTAMQNDKEEALYQISIEITYSREREG